MTLSSTEDATESVVLLQSTKVYAEVEPSVEEGREDNEPHVQDSQTKLEEVVDNSYEASSSN